MSATRCCLSFAMHVDVAVALLVLVAWSSQHVEAAHATRYWDCCKAHCSWPAKLFNKVTPLPICNKDDVKLSDPLTASSCGAATPNNAYTCYDNIPFRVSDTLAYGFAAVPATGDMCGKCYQLTFSGTGKDGPNPGAAALRGKSMIVQATNIGHDVADEQFDIMIPGGGVGLFDACTYQWGVQTSQLGAQYGGFLTQCQSVHGYNVPLDTYKDCVRNHCQSVFRDNQLTTMYEGCMFFVDWFQVADNPTLTYQEVTCPDAIVQVSGMSRSDSIPTPAPTPSPPAGQCATDTSQCGCSWANTGTCGTDDGTACNRMCCCQFRQVAVATTTSVASTSTRAATTSTHIATTRTSAASTSTRVATTSTSVEPTSTSVATTSTAVATTSTSVAATSNRVATTRTSVVATSTRVAITSASSTSPLVATTSMSTAMTVTATLTSGMTTTAEHSTTVPTGTTPVQIALPTAVSTTRELGGSITTTSVVAGTTMTLSSNGEAPTVGGEFVIQMADPSIILGDETAKTAFANATKPEIARAAGNGVTESNVAITVSAPSTTARRRLQEEGGLLVAYTIAMPQSGSSDMSAVITDLNSKQPADFENYANAAFQTASSSAPVLAGVQAQGATIKTVAAVNSATSSTTQTTSMANRPATTSSKEGGGVATTSSKEGFGVGVVAGTRRSGDNLWILFCYMSLMSYLSQVFVSSM